MLFKPTVPQLLTKGENRYRLVIASAKRARQIFAGSQPLVDTDDTAPVTIAADEIMADALKIYNEDEWDQKRKDYETNIKLISRTSAIMGSDNSTETQNI